MPRFRLTVSKWLVSIVTCMLVLPVHVHSASAQQAFFYSLVVPGWGQYLAGNKKSAGRFLFTEFGLWGGVFAYKKIEDVRVDNYRSYAAEHAQARTSNKNNRFFDDLGFYTSRLQHNQFARYDDGPDAEIYPETVEFFWEWDSELSRKRYKNLLNSSEGAERQVLLFQGLVVVNHLVSAIHAARIARSERPDEPGLKLQLSAMPQSFTLVLAKSLR